MISVRTRFAPSPTGMLHLGSARTALFNWLFARAQGGRFLLRIEDTDKARNTPEALDSIFQGLEWLGLEPDEPPLYQSQRAERHQEIAHTLWENGHAYWCDTTPEEVTALKEKARNEGQSPLYPSRQEGQVRTEKSVLRLKMPREGTITFDDQIQGTIKTSALQCEDLILLRSDGSPTYMLAVVVDDYDMKITHVIRGTDHLSNTPKQIAIYNAMGWLLPIFAHIPLIHGSDGAKLSKRHGAKDVLTYQKQGFLPEALVNALLRLGWGHGNQEIFSITQAQQLFNLNKVGASPARFDPKKLLALNSHYIRELSAEKLLAALTPFENNAFSDEEKNRLICGLPALAQRSETLVCLATQTYLYRDAVPHRDEKAQKILDESAQSVLKMYTAHLASHKIWTEKALEEMTRTWVETQSIPLKKIAQPLRAAIAGKTVSPPLFEMMACLGSAAVLKRLKNVERQLV